jgi:signal peptidase II
MKRKEWILISLPLLVVWYLDRITKAWALAIQGVQTHGLLNFSLHYNSGAMLGLFADLPPVLRIVSLSTGGAFLVVTYALVQYLLPIRSMKMRIGMSVLLGGILGNVSDRIMWGHVVDFIILGSPETYLSPAFNLADVFQWLGYILVVYAVAKDGSQLWPENNVRRRYWVNRKFQLKYCYMLLGVGVSISFVTMVFSYTFMKVAMVELVGPNPQLIDKFLTPYLITFSVVCTGFCVALFTVGKILSHKIAGPIYAFEKYVNELIAIKKTKAPVRKFRMRHRDEFQELETIASNLKQEIAPDLPEADLSENTNP